MSLELFDRLGDSILNWCSSDRMGYALGLIAVGTGIDHLRTGHPYLGVGCMIAGLAIQVANYLTCRTTLADRLVAHMNQHPELEGQTIKFEGLTARTICGHPHIHEKRSDKNYPKGMWKRCKTAIDVADKKRVARLVITEKRINDAEKLKKWQEFNATRMAKSNRILRALEGAPGVMVRYDSVEGTDKSNRPKFTYYEEYYSEGDLLHYLKNNTLSKQQRRDLTLQFLTALAALHERGVIHGDLKLENILVKLVDGNLQICITDFDDSWMEGEKLSELGCAPIYLSPERARAFLPNANEGPYSRFSWTVEAMVQNDLWAAGIIIYAINNNAKVHPWIELCEMQARAETKYAPRNALKAAFIRKIVDLKDDPRRLEGKAVDPMDQLVHRLMSPNPPSARVALEALS